MNPILTKPRHSNLYSRAAMRCRLDSIERECDEAYMREDYAEADRLAEVAKGYRVRLGLR